VTALLQLDAIDVSYGPLQVLFDVSLDVEEGQTVALLGTNGAGTSRLLKAAAGLVAPEAGTVRFAGEDVTQRTPEARVERGLTLVEGGKSTFPSLTVAENIRLGAYPFLGETAKVDARFDRALDLFPQLRPRLQQAAGTLSGGEQQMVAIARALMAEPRLLMIDELSLGLAPVVMAEILRVVEEIAATGMTILLVEQSLNIALGLAATAHFMEKGEIRFSGRSDDLLERGDLVRSVFFGEVVAEVIDV
jgi:ABC-type branched-subunit amino acid transport system ATPase component